MGLSAGDHAPVLAGQSIEGGRIDLAALRGRPVIVNFWASWCIPCRREFGVLEAALSRHSADGLAIVGVVFDDDPSSAKAFAQSAGATWPSLADPSGTLANRFRVLAPPQTYFVDRQGIVRNRQIGEIADEAEMEQLLRTIL